jgi:hypothetical protein
MRNLMVVLAMSVLPLTAEAGSPYYSYASYGCGNCTYQGPWLYYPSGVFTNPYGGKSWYPAGYWNNYTRYGFGYDPGVPLPVYPNSVQVLSLPAGLPPVQIAPLPGSPTMTGTPPAQPNPNQLTAEEVQQLRAILNELKTERAPVAKTK